MGIRGISGLIAAARIPARRHGEIPFQKNSACESHPGEGAAVPTWFFYAGTSSALHLESSGAPTNVRSRVAQLATGNLHLAAG